MRDETRTALVEDAREKAAAHKAAAKVNPLNAGYHYTAARSWADEADRLQEGA